MLQRNGPICLELCLEGRRGASVLPLGAGNERNAEAKETQMKKRRPSSPVPGGQKQTRGDTSEVDGVMPPRSESTEMMLPSAQKGKPRGRLNRTVLAMLGKGLEDCFDEIRRQEVPERFKLLLRQFR
jgi:hypothetical protein